MPYSIRRRPNHPTQAKVYAEDGRPLSKKWKTMDEAKKQRTAVILSEIGLSRPRTLPLGHQKANKFIK
jgi:hypothetical protein